MKFDKFRQVTRTNSGLCDDDTWGFAGCQSGEFGLQMGRIRFEEKYKVQKCYEDAAPTARNRKGFNQLVR